MMHRRLRRSFRTLSRTFDQARDFISNALHKNDYIPSSSLSPALSDSDNDDVFEEMVDRTLPPSSSTTLPCEFCHRQRPPDRLISHQIACNQNPDNQSYLTTIIPSAPPAHLDQSTSNSVEFQHRDSERSSIFSLTPSRPVRTPLTVADYVLPIPDGFQCPITSELFRDPVVAADGHTYEREAITQWITQQKTSPMTRQPMTVKSLRDNRVIKRMIETFLAECERHKARYKYKINVDVKKSDEIPFIETDDKALYRAEWLESDASPDLSVIVLMQLKKSSRAEEIADLNCRLELHPNIVRTFGRVEDNAESILLLQEYTFEKNLSEFLENTDHVLDLAIINHMVLRIISALKFLAQSNIIHGNLRAHNVFIFHLDQTPEETLVKLANIGHIPDLKTTWDYIYLRAAAPEVISKRQYSEKSDVFAFGILAQDMYATVVNRDDNRLVDSNRLSTQQRAMFASCLADDPNERPTFTTLSTTANSLINGEQGEKVDSRDSQ